MRTALRRAACRASLAVAMMLSAVPGARAEDGRDAEVVASPVAEPPVAEPAAPASTPGAAPRAAPLRLVASIGYDYGFNRLLEVPFDDGSTHSLRVNGGFVVAVGGAFLPLQGGRLETRATIGLKYDSIDAENGSVRYLAFPLEVVEALNVAPLRLSVGASLLLAPSVKGEKVLAGVDLELKSSVGLLGQVEWVLPFKAGGGALSAGVRLTVQKLEPEQGGTAEDASAFGAIVGVTL